MKLHEAVKNGLPVGLSVALDRAHERVADICRKNHKNTEELRAAVEKVFGDEIREALWRERLAHIDIEITTDPDHPTHVNVIIKEKVD